MNETQCCCIWGIVPYGQSCGPEFPCWNCPKHPTALMRRYQDTCKRHRRERMNEEDLPEKADLRKRL